MSKKITKWLIVGAAIGYLLGYFTAGASKDPNVHSVPDVRFSSSEADTLVPPSKKELTLEEKIQKEFQETPEMMKIVACESQFRQFKDGKPLISPTSDVGIMQINQVHWKRADKMGLDIHGSVDDNIAMGKVILEEQGLNAWTCYR